MHSFFEALNNAVAKLDVTEVNHILRDKDHLSPDEFKRLLDTSEHLVKEKSARKRTLIEKIMFYLGGTVALLYSLNLIAYSLSSYLREKMFEAHALTPHQVIPIALLLISVFGLMGFLGWYAPHNRLKKANDIKKALFDSASKEFNINASLTED